MSEDRVGWQNWLQTLTSFWWQIGGGGQMGVEKGVFLSKKGVFGGLYRVVQQAKGLVETQKCHFRGVSRCVLQMITSCWGQGWLTRDSFGGVKTDHFGWPSLEIRSILGLFAEK